MQRCKLNISIVWLSLSLGLTFACSDDSVGSAGTVGTETGATAASADAGDGTAGEAEAGLDGDGDGDSNTGDGDGDPNTGDGDGDPNTGTGDGDGAPGDGDGDGDGDPVCGDGNVDADLGEECDAGADNGPTSSCLGDCTLNVCGDGFEGPQEGCDDGNTQDDDGCSATCELEEVPEGAIFCGEKLFECGDTIDNDMDGLVDLDDPECISPCDDDEGTFKTNLPGQNKDCKADCYFDSNSGSGDDKCEWNLKCDPENPGEQVGCEYDPNFAMGPMCEIQMPQACIDFCSEPLVPNGCDCFGCCLIEGEYVYLDGAECSMDNLDDCASCTFNDLCPNYCEPENCEVCFGQDPDDLPPECTQPSCPDGVTPCFDESDCAVGQFCQTGCCIAPM